MQTRIELKLAGSMEEGNCNYGVVPDALEI